LSSTPALCFAAIWLMKPGKMFTMTTPPFCFDHRQDAVGHVAT
jgi:hypothetical protein